MIEGEEKSYGRRSCLYTGTCIVMFHSCSLVLVYGFFINLTVTFAIPLLLGGGGGGGGMSHCCVTIATGVLTVQCWLCAHRTGLKSHLFSEFLQR